MKKIFRKLNKLLLSCLKMNLEVRGPINARLRQNKGNFQNNIIVYCTYKVSVLVGDFDEESLFEHQVHAYQVSYRD